MTEEQESWKKRLLALGIAQRDFADMVGEDETVICQYFNGHREPRIEKFRKIEAKIQELEGKP